MPVNFLQKQETGRPRSDYAGPVRGIDPDAAAIQAGRTRGNIATKRRIPLLIRCRLHIGDYSMQLLIAAQTLGGRPRTGLDAGRPLFKPGASFGCLLSNV